MNTSATNGYRFALDGKALASAELESGDLIVQGYCALWNGVDREGENFEPGAFKRGIKAFLEGHAALCFHHKPSQGIGKVLELREDAKGLLLRARVDKQDPSSPLYYIYNAVKRGTYKGL